MWVRLAVGEGAIPFFCSDNRISPHFVGIARLGALVEKPSVAGNLVICRAFFALTRVTVAPTIRRYELRAGFT